jgi:triosephosphate isomerase
VTSDVLVAVSLKAYFGYIETCGWLRDVADMLTDRPLPASVELAVLPSFPLLDRTRRVLARFGVTIGAQDVSSAERGPATGEVPASLLAEMGCRYAEVGHAERRSMFGDNERVVAIKAESAVRNGLVPLICVGEQRRNSGAADGVARQARQVVDRLAGHSFVIAYEPVWAIGADEPADADEVLRIGNILRSSIPELDHSGQLIYGGTAGPGTLGRLSAEFDGVFLGRRAHQIEGLRQVLDEAADLVALRTGSE